MDTFGPSRSLWPVWLIVRQLSKIDGVQYVMCILDLKIWLNGSKSTEIEALWIQTDRNIEHYTVNSIVLRS